MRAGGLQQARLAYNDQGVPYSTEYGDVYHSADGALAQARQVFLLGNDLPGRWRGRDSFTIVETGFGPGLNFLCTWQAWREDGRRSKRLHFVSVECHPFSREDLARLHSAWPELAPLASALREHWPLAIGGTHRLHFESGQLSLTLLLGKAEILLPGLHCRADALYLDGFAPAKNPALWSPPLLRALSALAGPGATLATWSVAAWPRQTLAAAGWQLEKHPGFGHKREMLVGRLRGGPLPPTSERSAMIVGAGIAGCALAERLAARGWRVRLFERQLGPALEGSGNPVGIFLPLPAKDDNLVARISRACYLYAGRRLGELAARPAGLRWEPRGVVQIGRDAAHEQLQRQTVAALALPPAFIGFLERAQMSDLLGRTAARGGWRFPGGGWLAPMSLCRALLAAESPEESYATTVAGIWPTDAGWLARDRSGRVLGEAAHLILANAQDALRFAPELPLTRVRGQSSCLPGRGFAGIEPAVCCRSYLVPAGDIAHIGASFDADDDDTELRAASHEENLAGLEAMLPGSATGVRGTDLAGRVGFRSMSADRLPLVGTLPAPAAAMTPDLKLADMDRRAGLHCLLGLGARGLVWSLLMAEMLAAQLESEPLPLEKKLLAALDPARFLLRRLRRG